MIKVIQMIHTDGKGHWSNTSKYVKVVGFEVDVYAEEDDDELFGELRVYFDTKFWNTSEHGLIYSDQQFETELKKYLTLLHYDVEDLDYSEQGMQGRNYVSFDIGSKFIASHMAKGK